MLVNVQGGRTHLSEEWGEEGLQERVPHGEQHPSRQGQLGKLASGGEESTWAEGHCTKGPARAGD